MRPTAHRLPSAAVRTGFQRFARARDGGVAIAAALALPVLLMLGGGAVDLRKADAVDRRLQDAMDAAVLSGAGAGTGGSVAAAEAAFAAHAEPEFPPATFTASGGVVSGAASGGVATSFLPLIGIAALPVRAQARAVNEIQRPPCVLLMEPTATGLSINSGSELNTLACPVHVRSSSNEAVFVNSGSKLFSRSLCVRGSVRRNGGSRVEPSAVTHCPALNDPLESIPEPVVPGPCPDKHADAGQTLDLSAGCYGKITANSGGRIRLGPGVYRITDEFLINSGSHVSASGVTLYLSAATSKLVTNSGSTLELTPPTSGPMAGIAVFQTRDASQANKDALHFNSGAHGLLEGVMYARHAEAVFNSNASGGAAYTMIIVKTLNLNSGSKVQINANYTSGPPLPRVLRTVRLES